MLLMLWNSNTRKNSCFTIKLDDDKYFNDYKHWNIKTNKNKYYDCSVKESLKMKI